MDDSALKVQGEPAKRYKLFRVGSDNQTIGDPVAESDSLEEIGALKIKNQRADRRHEIFDRRTLLQL